TATAAPSCNPRRAAHAALRRPTAWSEVYVSVYSLLRNPPSKGSSALRKSSAGRPPNDACHIALWPAAQRLRFIDNGSVCPHSDAGIQSQCSTQEYALERTASSVRRICRIFDQNHSDE